MRTLNGANSQMLSRVTGKSVQQEARADTTSYDLLKHIRRMRIQWLGQILRSNSDNIVAQSVKVEMEMNSPGNILMDAPAHNNFHELVTLAIDKAFWREHVQSIF